MNMESAGWTIFGPVPVACVKCGSTDHGKRWYKNDSNGSGLTVGGKWYTGGECLIVTCLDCGYEWTRPCLDAEETS